MSKFLEIVARDIYNKFGNQLNRVVIVFPNNRAGIFMDEYLSDLSGGQPMWAPHYITISELFNKLCPLKKDDDIKTICRLHKIYCNHLQQQISLDTFFGWGRQLMSDFNNADKNFANIEQLFSNVKEAKILDNLSDEQRIRLTSIFGINSNSDSDLKKNFKELWQLMIPIYKELNAELAKDGEAYDGARYRKVIENLEHDKTPLNTYDHYVIVGFNMLLKTEKRLFSYLQQAGKATFYWDYDQYFVENSSFHVCDNVCKNIEYFPNALSEESYNNFEQDKTINIVETTTFNVQARYVSQWLEKNLDHQTERNTAIVLCDENMLQPIMYSLPDFVKEVNITKGFPMGNTQAFNEVYNYLKNATESDNSILLHKLSEHLISKAKEGVTHYQQGSWQFELHQESYFQLYTTTNRFINLVDSEYLTISTPMLVNVMLGVMKQISIPFHGEPATGLQVMGMLETRNLDFDNILILSVNEGIVPKKGTDHSFIPYDLRKYYGLTTNDEQAEVYAYNFYRLLWRAKHITMVYNGAASGDNMGVKSRFITHLEVSTSAKINHFTIDEARQKNERLTSLPKNTEIEQLLNQKGTLSPSAINTYINCPMRFFFSNLAGINEYKTPDFLLPSNTIGSIFHATMNNLYDPNHSGSSVVIDEKKIKDISDITIDQAITTAFSQVQDDEKKHGNTVTLLPSEHPIEISVVKQWTKRQLQADLAKVPFQILSMEQWKGFTIENLKVGGIIDRLEISKHNGVDALKVVDYKTGRFNEKKLSATSFDNLFYDKDHTYSYMMQLFIYSMLCSKLGLDKPNGGTIPIIPTLSYVSHKEPYCLFQLNKQEIDDFCKQLGSDFEQRLTQLIASMKSGDMAEAEDKVCSKCPFTLLCGKEV